MGMSTAYNLTKFLHPSRICVLEPDPTYVRSASALSWASIRQQFSLVENINLSQSSIKFIKDIDRHLSRSIIYVQQVSSWVASMLVLRDSTD